MQCTITLLAECITFNEYSNYLFPANDMQVFLSMVTSRQKKSTVKTTRLAHSLANHTHTHTHARTHARMHTHAHTHTHTVAKLLRFPIPTNHHSSISENYDASLCCLCHVGSVMGQVWPSSYRNGRMPPIEKNIEHTYT